PLLFEAGLRHLVDLVLLVYAPPEEQVRRLTLRSGCSRDEADRRLAAQMPIGEKIPLADIVICNEGPLEETRRAVCRIWGDLLREEKLRRSERAGQEIF
ncbi:MAG: dephospho-CoA kinase, partial [Deltaproteobacteria bacterium]